MKVITEALKITINKGTKKIKTGFFNKKENIKINT